MRRLHQHLWLLCLSAVTLSCGSTRDLTGARSPARVASLHSVHPLVETDPALGDLDDTAVWIDPDDPSQSLIIAADKEYGLMVYGLDGRQRQALPDGAINNIDLRGGAASSLIAVTNRDRNEVDFYTISPERRALERLPSRSLRPDFRIYGLCLFQGVDALYVFVTAKSGEVGQWRVTLEDGEVVNEWTRTLTLGSVVEGCVADDAAGTVFISEEDVGIWRYDARPDGAPQGYLIDRVGAGHLASDVEGLALYLGDDGAGYLIASSQGDDTFAIYERGGENAFLMSFEVLGHDGIDSVEHTDGVEVISTALGPSFPEGMLLVQDGANEGDSTNVKLIPWGALSRALNALGAADASE